MSLDGPAADVPDGTLSRSGMCIRESTEDAYLPRNVFVVEAFETSAHHSGRGAVAEATRAAEAVARAVVEAQGIERGGEERGGLEVVGRGQPELAPQVAPVRGQRGELRVPRVGERAPVDDGQRRCGARRDELEPAGDLLVVEAAQHPANCFGSESAAAARGRETDRASGAAGIRRAEQRRGTFAAARVVDQEQELRLAPARIQGAFDTAPLHDEFHGPESRLLPVAKV